MVKSPVIFSTGELGLVIIRATIHRAKTIMPIIARVEKFSVII